MNELKKFIETEIENLKGLNCVEIKIKELDSSFMILLSISVTTLRSVKTIIIIPPSYPTTAISIDLESKTIPISSLEKLHSKCEENIRKLIESKSSQIVIIVKLIVNALKRSLLLFCYEDIEYIKKYFLTEQDNIEVIDKKGLIKITTHNEGFINSFEVKVPFDYPSSAITFTSVSSSYPTSINQFFFSQSNEISRRLSLGLSLGNLDRKLSIKNENDKIAPLSVQQYRHDIKFLKERSAIEVNATDKQARRNLRRFEKSEVLKELENIKNQEPENKKNINKYFHGFLPAITFLFNEFFIYLPKATCGFCNKRISTYFLNNSSNLPERNTCGHWFHFNCLKTLMTTPPFGKKCPIQECNSSIYSKNWSFSEETLEKRWALKEAHNRENEDIKDFFNL